MQRNKVIFFTVSLICIQQNIVELFSGCVKWQQGNLSSKCSIECRELADERFLLCELCMIAGCSSVFTVNLKQTGKQLRTSHCNYCACSLDIFHKSSQIAKFFSWKKKKRQKKKAVEAQLQWLISAVFWIQQLLALINGAFETLVWRLLLCLLKTVLIPYWMPATHKARWEWKNF